MFYLFIPLPEVLKKGKIKHISGHFEEKFPNRIKKFLKKFHVCRIYLTEVQHQNKNSPFWHKDCMKIFRLLKH